MNKDYMVIGNVTVNIAVLADMDSGECNAMICDKNLFDIGTYTDGTYLVPLSSLPLFLQENIMDKTL